MYSIIFHNIIRLFVFATAGLKAEDMLPGVEIDTHPAMPKMQKIIDQGAVILDY